ncbi:fimbria/pilus outer membrane usher protein [Escherichia coli]|uniref:fimbria/pilus outer membrane usher protein n=1 Tax=Escherichia coli TaxID=562 RepID=UPI000A189163|nr:fimbria/pilus outer membrane usher protein [Escherichia coli]EHR9374855.1 fimbria/pilus outer membrane usher protein [Escherichia coli]MDO1548467.1 fimbria/pilus outer membrane usher protein [Escherichia coli]MDO1557685.1 fimbria/pilus outer membrane usher protein [Escherichia coli]MEC9736544.1 fimbria/pilus outer membrane usher protein [Escherichia coli]OSK33982.1 fimbrial usher protein [Escherichia coli B671]
MNTKSTNLKHKKLLATFVSLVFTNAHAEGYYFNNSDLKSFGVTSDNANQLLQSDALQPGAQRLSFLVNGRKVPFDGRVVVENDGRPCLTTSLLNDLDIDTNQLIFDKSGCLINGGGSNLIVKTNPKHQEIEFIAPINMIASNKSGYVEGGNAALLNYSLHGFNVKGKNSRNDSYAGFITSGFNTNNWIFRNKSTVSSYNGENEFKNNETYAQKTFESLGKTLRVGDVDYYDQFYGVSLRGLQWTPDPSLAGGPVTSLQGFSNEDSQITVYQLGQLVYAGRVQAGFYKINSVPVLNSQAPYEIVLTGPSGGDTKSIVTAAEASIYQTAQYNDGLSLAVGKATNIKSKYNNEPLMATTSYNWKASDNLTVGAGTLFTDKYYSLAGQATYSFTPRNSISVYQYVSDDKSDPETTRNGSSTSVLLTNALGERFSLSNSLKYRTDGYRGVEDLGLNYSSFYKWQQSNSLSTSLNPIGSLSLSYSINEGDGHKENNYSFTWGRNFYSAYVTATLQKQKVEYNNKLTSETRLYAQLSIPLSNKQRVISSYTSSDEWHRLSADYRSSEDSGFNYGVGYTKETNKSRTLDTVSVEASKTAKFAHVGGRVNANDDFKSLATYVSGGVLINSNAVTFSPYEIGDTFALVKVGEHPDIEIQTPNGKVWTDSKGNAVVSSLSSFSSNLIEVNTKTAPQNLDIMSGVKRVTPSRGTFKNIVFDAKKVNRLLVYAVDKNNKPLPSGAFVTDAHNDAVVGFVEQGGMIFFNDVPKHPVKVNLGNNMYCSMKMNNGTPSSQSGAFTTVHEICD